jgi:hypothetical protein
MHISKTHKIYIVLRVSTIAYPYFR